MPTYVLTENVFKKHMNNFSDLRNKILTDVSKNRLEGSDLKLITSMTKNILRRKLRECIKEDNLFEKYMMIAATLSIDDVERTDVLETLSNKLNAIE